MIAERAPPLRQADPIGDFQFEADLIIRGIVRPGDISSANTVASSSLSNLEIEMKGKGIISDSVRPPNVLTRAILWLFGF